MSRSNYTYEVEDQWQAIMYRGAVVSAIRGARGQALLKDLVTALDALPEPKLIAKELQANGCFCALGAVANFRGVDFSKLGEFYAAEQVSKPLDIADALAAEIMFINDEDARYNETPEYRWARMRNWAQEKILQETK
jgi:hypothetical protein